MVRISFRINIRSISELRSESEFTKHGLDVLCSLHLCLPANVLHHVLHYKELTFTFHNYLGSAKDSIQSACNVSILICKVSILIYNVSILICKVSILACNSTFQFCLQLTAVGKNLWHMIGWFQQHLKSKGQATPPQ